MLRFWPWVSSPTDFFAFSRSADSSHSNGQYAIISLHLKSEIEILVNDDDPT